MTTTLSTTTRAVVYCRISADKLGDEAGVTRQREDSTALCEQRGWSLAGTFTDNDLSATSGKHRPDYAAMLEAAERGEFDVLVCWHLSRLWRNRRERAEGIERLKAARVSIRCVRGPDLDLSTAYGRAMAGLLGEFDTMEVEVKSERQRRAAQQAAEAGKATGGGSRPYGYAADKMTVIESEAAVIRECAARLLAGETLRSVAADLNRRGIASTTGKQWSTTALRAMLCSARISGRRSHTPGESGVRRLCGEITCDTAVWPAIISVADSDRLRALLSRPERRTSPGTARKTMLSGILVCSLCGRPMVSRPRSGVPRYICNDDPGRGQGMPCGKTAVHGEHTNDRIRDLVLAALENPDLVERLRHRGNPEPDLIEQIRADEDELEQLAADLGNREISRAEWKAARAPVVVRLEAARSRLSRNSRTTALDSFVGTWEEMSSRWELSNTSQRRAVVTAVVESIVVHPPAIRGRFDPERFDPLWRA